MNKNIGTFDRIARIIASAVGASLFFTNTVTGVAGWIILAASGVLLITALLRFCPLYTLLGIQTCKTNQ